MQESRRKSLQVSIGLVSHLLLLLFLLFMQIKSTESGNISLPGCPDKCGEVEIPYPFGIGSDCSMQTEFTYFNISCNTTTSTPLALLFDLFEIVNIDVSRGEARFKVPVVYKCYNTTTKTDEYTDGLVGYIMSAYWVNNEKNKFAVFGCNTLAYLSYNFSFDTYNISSYEVGCLSTCQDVTSANKYGKNCSGVGCCQTAIPFRTSEIFIRFDERYEDSEVYRCSYAMLMADEPGSEFNTSYITSHEPIQQSFPVVFNWAIGNTTCHVAKTNLTSYACKSHHSECVDVPPVTTTALFNNSVRLGYICNCSSGYEGNPYLDEGCQDIDECTATQTTPCSKPAKCHNLPGNYSCSCPFGWRKLHDHHSCQLNLHLIIGSIIAGCAGIVVISLLGFVIYVVMERSNLSKIKEKYFQQHGGWILLENIKSTQGFGFTVFTKQQIEQATNDFDDTNIIGHGGQGTVYKGTLRDQTVAIKKCKIVDETKKKEFGKEMLILSQINHKNIVKLLGCCLEVEVPILVYEFISNGTLFHYIHNKKPRSAISLSTRLRIAHESAEALAYLHTSASPPIFHGDIKSANILLDQNYTAKVSDFGASILAPTDEAQIVTFVQGTCGYLDPEYMQSCQLTDKSDVYSFGVVLVELLTSKHVIDFDVPEEERCLSSRFLIAMKENKMQELIDDEIKNDEDMELIREVAELAKVCMNMRGDERPTMKEVADELDQIRNFKQHPWRQVHHPEETEHFLGISEPSSHHIEIEDTGSFSVEKTSEKNIAAR